MNRDKTYPWYFTSGALILFFTLFFIPSILGVYYSFTDWNSFSDTITFVGLDNFKTIFFTDKMYLSYIGSTIKFTIYTTIIKTIITLSEHANFGGDKYNRGNPLISSSFTDVDVDAVIC